MHQIPLPRTILTGLLHRLDLAPAVLIIAGLPAVVCWWGGAVG